MAKQRKNDGWFRSPHGSIHIYDRGGFWQFYIARRGTKPTRRSAEVIQRSADTTSYAEACRKAQALLESWNPDKVRIAELEAKKAAETVTISEAVNRFLTSAEERLGDRDGAYHIYKVTLGGTEQTRAPHALLIWTEQYNTTHLDKLQYVSQLSASVLESWRHSWTTLDPSTKSNRWKIVGMFIRYTMNMGWITGVNPYEAAGKLAPVPSDGTGIFSDEQWLDFSQHCEPGRERAFFELLRWGGMGIVDGVTFDKHSLTNGVLHYHRYKLRKKSIGWAMIKLPPHVLELLEPLPGDQPFLDKGYSSTRINTDVWRRRFMEICTKAGITSIRTANGTERPHPHALRDTAAVYLLRRTRDVRFVAQCLGHSSSAMTEKKYLPFVPELRQQHLEICDRALADVPQAGTETRVQ